MSRFARRVGEAAGRYLVARGSDAARRLEVAEFLTAVMMGMGADMDEVENLLQQILDALGSLSSDPSGRTIKSLIGLGLASDESVGKLGRDSRDILSAIDGKTGSRPVDDQAASPLPYPGYQRALAHTWSQLAPNNRTIWQLVSYRAAGAGAPNLFTAEVEPAGWRLASGAPTGDISWECYDRRSGQLLALPPGTLALVRRSGTASLTLATGGSSGQLWLATGGTIPAAAAVWGSSSDTYYIRYIPETVWVPPAGSTPSTYLEPGAQPAIRLAG